MVVFTKYLSICVILASSKFIGAMKFPADDCDYDKETGSDYFASGSAHSSQFLTPDGSVLTSSKGSSVSSDGVQRTFHELKNEANKFVSKSSSDGITIPAVPIIPDIPASHFSPFYKKNSFSTGEQSSFSAAQSGASGSSQYFDQQQYSQVPADSKITTIKKQEVTKNVITKSSAGSLPIPELTGEFDVEQNQGANSNANVNTLIYKPVGVSAADRSGYSSSHHQESKSIKVSSSNLNPELDTAYQPIYYRPNPLDAQRIYEQSSHGRESIKVSGSKVNVPPTYTSKTIIYPSGKNSEASTSSSLAGKFESYSQRHDANSDIPSYLVNKPNTFSTNVVDLDKVNNEGKLYKSITAFIPTKSPDISNENHYASESHNKHTEQTEIKQFAVPARPEVTKAPIYNTDNEEVESLRPEELGIYGNKHVVVSQKLVAVPNTDSRHTQFLIKVQPPTQTVGSSQIIQKETHSHSTQTVSSDSGANLGVLPVTEVRENEGAAHIGKYIRPVSLSAAQSQTSEHVEENEQKSGDSVPGPILVHGVPQPSGYYSSQSGSSSSHSFSSGSQFGESTGASQNLKYTDGVIGLDKTSLFGNADQISIPVQTYVSPVHTYVSPVRTYISPQSSSKSSSSSSYHYVSSNGQSGEQLVPNSNIFVSPEGSSLHQSHSSLLQNLGKSNIGSDTEFASSSFGVPQKKTFGFSTAYSSHSSNINGKVTENREAAVAVNDNGKIDSYHVKS